jgi:6-phosphogluconolactonase (cycloisomerase 2 family)
MHPSGQFLYGIKGDGRIGGFSVNPATGILTPLDQSMLPLNDLPTALYISFSPDGSFAYVPDTSIYVFHFQNGSLAALPNLHINPTPGFGQIDGGSKVLIYE